MSWPASTTTSARTADVAVLREDQPCTCPAAIRQNEVALARGRGLLARLDRSTGPRPRRRRSPCRSHARIEPACCCAPARSRATGRRVRNHPQPARAGGSRARSSGKATGLRPSARSRRRGAHGLRRTMHAGGSPPGNERALARGPPPARGATRANRGTSPLHRILRSLS